MAQTPKPAEGRQARIGFFDIEATNLNANFGYMLCACVKELGQRKVHTYSVLDYPKAFERRCTNDKYVLRDLITHLNTLDIIVTWYGKSPRRFDMPFITSRALFHGLDIVNPRIAQVDLWMTSRNLLKLTSNRLDTVGKFFRLQEEKTALLGQYWVDGAAGHKPSIKYIMKHCQADVRVLEEIYLKFRQIMDAQHPNINLLSGRKKSCPICGGSLWNKGYSYTRARRKKNYKCRTCGHYSQGPSEPVMGGEIR